MIFEKRRCFKRHDLDDLITTPDPFEFFKGKKK